MDLPERIEFRYVGDPMCSWCWGFAPVLERMAERYAIPIRTIVGGLRPGPSAGPLDETLRRTLAEHWHHVEEASGQPFDHTTLAREDWVYDTELAAIGVVTMRDLHESETLRFFTRLQRAYYVENIDITDADVYPDLVDDFDVDPGKFSDLFASQTMREQAWADFELARRLSVTGFPSLLLRLDEDHIVVTRGYLGWETLEPALTGWLREQFGEGVAALINQGASAAPGWR